MGFNVPFLVDARDVHCPADHAVVGGGLVGQEPDSNFLVLRTNGPLDADSWRVVASNGQGTNVTAYVYALCIPN